VKVVKRPVVDAGGVVGGAMGIARLRAHSKVHQPAMLVM
jgi:hypothetical protein